MMFLQRSHFVFKYSRILN